MKDGLKMNKDNMQRLIDAIKFDGQKKFNMSTFIGKFEYQHQMDRVFEGDDLASEYPANRVAVIEEGTDIFNCTSMGCIAGFATAIASGWKAPSWLSQDDHIGQINNFENTSNNFLGFTHAEGKNLYYGDKNCIWKWLMKHEPMKYPNLALEECESLDDAEESGYQWDSDDLYIDFSTIDYLTAVDVLTRIMNQEIGLSCVEMNQPYYVRADELVS